MLNLRIFRLDWVGEFATGSAEEGEKCRGNYRLLSNEKVVFWRGSWHLCLDKIRSLCTRVHLAKGLNRLDFRT